VKKKTVKRKTKPLHVPVLHLPEERKVAVTEGTETFRDVTDICSVTSASLETLEIHPLQQKAANASTLRFAAMVLDQ